MDEARAAFPRGAARLSTNVYQLPPHTTSHQVRREPARFAFAEGQVACPKAFALAAPIDEESEILAAARLVAGWAGPPTPFHAPLDAAP